MFSSGEEEEAGEEARGSDGCWGVGLGGPPLASSSTSSSLDEGEETLDSSLIVTLRLSTVSPGSRAGLRTGGALGALDRGVLAINGDGDLLRFRDLGTPDDEAGDTCTHSVSRGGAWSRGEAGDETETGEVSFLVLDTV